MLTSQRLSEISQVVGPVQIWSSSGISTISFSWGSGKYHDRSQDLDLLIHNAWDRIFNPGPEMSKGEFIVK
jgi:hypothetical protein